MELNSMHKSHPVSPPCELHYKLLSGNELQATPPMRWIVRGVLPADGIAAIYGPSMSGKSFLAIDLANAVSQGKERWFNYKVYSVPVTYLCLEGEAGLSKRINALAALHGQPISDKMKFVTQQFNLLSDDVYELAKSILKINGKGGLVVIDTLNRAALGIDENSSSDMGKIIAACERLRELIGGLILLIHHTGKTDDKGPRGHSSLFAALDGGIETKGTENPREWKLKKAKDEESGLLHPFNLNIVHIGVDEEGEEVSSCIVAPCEGIVTLHKRPKVPTAKQRIIWDTLCKLFKESKIYGKGGAPAMKACLEYEYAIEKAMSSYPCEKHRQRERTKEAITKMVSKGFLIFKDSWLWVAD